MRIRLYVFEGGLAGAVPPGVLLRAARDLLPNPEHSITSIAKLLGVGVGTLYNHIPDLQELRAARQQAIESQPRTS
ncbi:hypothetical protein [Streptosporangium lutulentum]|uniref:AcrR family transcriptional regulator n=1 Tax=Streptosporangium lutulentum TaxID=1461250 RepID=A0ABT9Q9V0_9ACTN|nr:hypothetical protein [Streptosporangium lutulentum]MDP9843494.1 AcrR family transcriptional regulator [Streptosporangium lutulentum]